jgi:F0F1-type ATP synthase delta subunit
MAPKVTANMKLSSVILGIAEVNQALKELDLLDNQISQRTMGYFKAPTELFVGRLLDSLVTINNLDLKLSRIRVELKSFLEDIKAHAPIIHISFAQDVMGNELEPIINWMRTELSPTALLQVGLQPEIIGGCTLRTVNHYYDLSLKQHFDEARTVLLSKIKAL